MTDAAGVRRETTPEPIAPPGSVERRPSVDETLIDRLADVRDRLGPLRIRLLPPMGELEGCVAAAPCSNAIAVKSLLRSGNGGAPQFFPADAPRDGMSMNVVLQQ